MQSDYFATHAHSEFSWLDGMGTVEQMVQKVVDLDQPGLALTDHGVMAGVIRLYKECRKHDIAPFPGEEFYFVTDKTDEEARKHRYHLGLLALDAKGFHALIQLSSQSHRRENFHRKPLIDWGDLAALADADQSEHIALTTGCYFGLVVQTLITSGVQAATGVVKSLASLGFQVFVELQMHGIDREGQSDLDIARDLVTIADTLGLPVVAGQDSHYCDGADQPVHDLMKDICYFGDDDDNRFPGGPYHLASSLEMKQIFKPIKGAWDRIEQGHGYLLDLNTLMLPELDTYHFHVPSMSKQPDRALKSLADRGMHVRGLDLFDSYQRRLKRELEVISKMGFANYFLLVADVTEWCRKNGVIVNARGSANGSLVCYVTGITNVDPLQWNTMFERFLSLDRMKPPDIDIDVESSQRHLLIDYIKTRYPSMVQIGTYSRLGITEEYDEMAGTGEDKGSVFVQYMAAKRRKGVDLEQGIPASDRRLLGQLADMKVRKAPGAHAAGFVLPGDDLPIDKYLATMLIPSSDTTVTQAVMEDVEDCGYLKLDILGLRSLATLNRCLVMIGRNPNDFDWIPWDDKRTCQVLRSGKPVGVFQYEGGATSRGARQMKVRNTHDAITCLALYRPALMNGGQTENYLEARETGQVRTYHPAIDRILEDTYGVAVFQEQVMDIMRAVGLSFQELNDVMKAVKASNDKIDQYAEATFKKTKPRFITLGVELGMDRSTAEAVWQLVMDFSDYGFNRAHATSYGIMAYRSAYLKAHHPLEYMAALLQTWAGTKKEPQYIHEARRMKITIRRPDVNLSDVLWTIDRSRKSPTLIKGLLSIDGIGPAVAEVIAEERKTNGDYQDIEDFIDRLPARPVSGGKQWRATGSPNGVMRTLLETRALRSLGVE